MNIDQKIAPQPHAKRRARHALARVRKVESGESRREQYLNGVKALPATIIRNGLLSAIVTEISGGAKEGRHGQSILCADVADWLLRNWDAAPVPFKERKSGSSSELIDALLDVRLDQAATMRVQAETLAWLDWLKKFSVAFLGDDEEGSR